MSVIRAVLVPLLLTFSVWLPPDLRCEEHFVVVDHKVVTASRENEDYLAKEPNFDLKFKPASDLKSLPGKTDISLNSTANREEGASGWEFLQQLEFDQPITGLALPKGWLPGVDQAIKIQTVAIRPDPRGLYSLGWRPCLFLCEMAFGGSELELKSLIQKLSVKTRMPVYVVGFSTREGGWPHRNLLARDGVVLCEP